MPNSGDYRMYVLCALAIVNSATNGYDGSMMNGLQTLTYWNEYFNFPDAPTLGLLNAIMSVGGTIGVFAGPPASDILGRKKAIILGSLIMLLGVGLQTGAANIQMFIAARFILGFGLAITSNAAPTLVIEIAHPTHRGKITALYNTMWYLGSIIAAWTTFGTLQIKSDWAWRVPSVIQAFPSIIQLCSVWFYEESPRWLISKGRDEEALAILAKLHADGNDQDELVQLEYREIRQTIAQEKEVAKRSYLELIATPGNRMRLFITITIGFFSQWSGNGLVSYYLGKVLDSVGVTDPFTQLLINGILQIWNLICAVTAAVVVDKVGRRPLWLASTAGMLIFFVLQTICTGVYTEKGVSSAGTASIAMIFLYYMSYDAAWTPLTVSYVVEIMPFTIRAKGMAVQGLCVNLALFFNSYVNPVALKAIGWKYYIVYCVWLVFELFIVWKFYVETKGRTLEELAEIFDGDQAALVIAEAKRLEAVGAEKINSEDAAYGTEKV
ncbi:hypothetical protein K450DRAFT_212247 [Umbelopsis ramanniana AG]|uniref:Major facilitator superfamily (MFS) profile domain-containing protein n=1 Tax=Umbelopsis ramanniana AG TaxID=1314678 RepID=A0AAD5E5S4_UMBRA|nr:uncharacterized protein K450DRAFT_212247 [Umbelopsis ramanniana AG]KAI8577911.1 hypothetical protein K450DRAFT_212247 [Umbelopsis ramanniana AG]